MAQPLQVTIGGYPTTVTKSDTDGSVTLAIDVGFPIGTYTLTVPQAEWQQIAAYVEKS